MNGAILEGKRILVVDDEPDILATVAETLTAAQVVKAGSFDAARKLIVEERFDLAILDIMGVNGFFLLEACCENKLPVAMFTAHAMTAESLNAAIKMGAVSFIPKEALHQLPEIVAEILEGLKQGRTHWVKVFHRFGPIFRGKMAVSRYEDEGPRLIYY
jgi:DNA-binding NtrC family response regulator